MITMIKSKNGKAIDYSDFAMYLQSNQIESVEVGEVKITGKFNQDGIDAQGEKASESFTVDYKQQVIRERLVEQLEQSKVKYKFAKEYIWLWSLLQILFPIYAASSRRCRRDADVVRTQQAQAAGQRQGQSNI